LSLGRGGGLSSLSSARFMVFIVPPRFRPF
jgi:hypothetical protein